MACDSAGRIGFVVPTKTTPAGESAIDDWDNNGSSDGEKEFYAAYLYYAPMKEFLSWAKNNHTANSKKRDSSVLEEDHEPET